MSILAFFKQKSVSFVVFGLAFLIGLFQLFYPGQSDFFLLDLQTLLSHTLTGRQTISDDIIVVLIDEASYRELKLRPDASFRPYHARLLETLQRAKAGVVAFDLVFVSSEADTDERLAEVMARSDNLIAGEIREGETLGLFRDRFKALGNLNTQDYWQIPRRIELYPHKTEQRAFAFDIVELYRQKQTGQQTGRPAASGTRQGREGLWINYRYRPDYFPVISYTALLAADDERIADDNRTPLSFLYGKIVLIGYFQDQCRLPVPAGKMWSGVYVHAYAAENLLQNTDLKQVNPYLNILFIFSLLLVIRLLGRQKTKIVALGGPWLSLLIVFCLHSFLLTVFSLWFNLSSLLFSSLGYLVLNSIASRIRNARDLHALRLKLQEFEQWGARIRASLADAEPSGEEQASKVLLMHNAFHDIKNYVVNIETCIKMLADRYKDDKGFGGKVGIIRMACKNIEHLTKNMLEVKQLEEGKIKPALEDCTCELVLAIARESIRDPGCELKNLKVTLQPPVRDFTFRADTNYLKRILYNLFHNAIKYSLPDGDVRLTCEAVGDEVIISLYNTGIPLTEEQKVRVFEKYYTVSGTASASSVPGASAPASASSPASARAHSQGLGLYFCRLIQQAQQGRIWVENEPAGNCFKLAFKAAG